jgi:predicted SAM-dependent methyltransferase
MCHVLEHVPHTETTSVIRAMRSALKPGGVLRIAVPDFRKIVEIYRANGEDMRSIIGPLMGGQDYVQNFHFAAFDEHSLTHSIKQCGFEQVASWHAGSVAHHDFEDWSNRELEFNGQRFPISLNLQAIRT